MTTAPDTKPLSITSPVEDDDRPGPEFTVSLDGHDLTARRPKIAMWMLAMGIFGDKYADDADTSRAVFDFLAASLDRPSWQHIRGRLIDGADTFSTAGLSALFEGLVEQMRLVEPHLTDDPDEQRPANRAARRAAPRRG